MSEMMRRIQFGRDGRVTLYGSNGVIGILVGNEAALFTETIIAGLGAVERARGDKKDGATQETA